MARIKKMSSEVVHQNPWWRYCRDKILLPNGAVSEYYYGEAKNSGGALVIPILDDGRVVLTIQHRYPRDRQSIEFPCGGLGVGEQASVCAQRELLEETGYRVADLVKIGTFDAMTSCFKNTAHVFIGTGLERIGEAVGDPSEQIEVILRRIDEFEDMLERGEIWDGHTLAAWAMGKNRVYQLLAM